jgi:hypothetical protein
VKQYGGMDGVLKYVKQLEPEHAPRMKKRKARNKRGRTTVPKKR